MLIKNKHHINTKLKTYCFPIVIFQYIGEKCCSRQKSVVCAIVRFCACFYDIILIVKLMGILSGGIPVVM